MAKPRKKTTVAPVVTAPCEPPPPAKPLPEWFSSGPATPDNRRVVRTYSQFAYQVVEVALAGQLGLPQFQRGAVWTREQQVLLLDSLVRGWPCGALLVWQAPRGTPCRALEGCPAPKADARPFLILDGQQRVSALVAAARGEIEAKWDGERWGATGYLTAQMCFSATTRSQNAWWDYQCSVHDYAPETWHAMLKAWENVHRAEVQTVTIERADEATALESYRRFNSTGTAHKASDLA